jgi:hypothetical protein
LSSERGAPPSQHALNLVVHVLHVDEGGLLLVRRQHALALLLAVLVQLAAAEQVAFRASRGYEPAVG